MLSKRELFFKHVGQTSYAPPAIEVESASGSYVYDTSGKKYLDLIAGVSVGNVGHCHPKVVEAVKTQAEKYMHVMVYGEYILNPQVAYAERLCSLLPTSLNSVFYVNSGSEAVEAAMKLAKRYTGRSEIVAFKNAYHGSTHGAASIMSSNAYTYAYRPLVPVIRFLDFNDCAQLDLITEKTAAVFFEFVQSEAGYIPANQEFALKLRERCSETGTLLIADEVQTGFGRTGKLFAFEHYNIVPDILVIAKGMGGGMPIGALVADKFVTDAFTNNPVLGHITTFGGHPVSAAAALASLDVIVNENVIEQIAVKSKLFIENLIHPKIADVRGFGLMLSVGVGSFENVKNLILKGFELGFLTDWFLFEDKRFRISPPLTISNSEINTAVSLIKKALSKI